ncbi:DUF4336 domain-containing protein [Roseovarius sp. SCSIO 43702]|uniref:DUF4336 domain-containing protein n=1 Tax=Roseovarius sp. SCSIO 43702 TaxID=2823043 RepID=UPI001C733923|nr:DUF4336 domain-containing protein [Roseovarius sp. SCSIO 43702]QYX57406.1 DUF4336 domain-containing protein [Roseovarius sp. SCSIO 43702]
MREASRPTGYEPLDTLKIIGPSIWIVDGPHVSFYGLPFSTRATVVRLENGDLWVHSPTRLTEGLKAELGAEGRVAHLVAPNWIHYSFIAEWQAAFPDALAWAAPGVAGRAAKHGLDLSFDHDLGHEAEAPWRGQIDQMIVEGSKAHREAVFHHRQSGTLILTDLIENFETAKLPVWMRPLIWLAGIDDSDGKMPPDMMFSFRRRDLLADAVERMIAWAPDQLVLAHGRWFRSGAVGELERAFRRVLRKRRWEEVAKRIDEDRRGGS